MELPGFNLNVAGSDSESSCLLTSYARAASATTSEAYRRAHARLAAGRVAVWTFTVQVKHSQASLASSESSA